MTGVPPSIARLHLRWLVPQRMSVERAVMDAAVQYWTTHVGDDPQRQ